MDDNKNLITFLVLSMLIFLIWSTMGQRRAAEIREEAAKQEQLEQEGTITTPEPVVEVIENQPREVVLSAGERKAIKIETESLTGSFQLQGSRFDDISLKNYNQTIEDDSPYVVLLTPYGTDGAAFISDNWALENKGTGIDTPWQLVSGSTLTPDSNIVLRYNGDGFRVNRTVSIDNDFMITLNDKVTNTSGGNINITRQGLAKQYGIPTNDGGDARDLSFILHQGAIAIVDDREEKLAYGDFEDEREASYSGQAGWVGLTSKYWLSAAIAPQGQEVTARFKYKNENNQQIFESGYTSEVITITPGVTIDSTGYIFAGAKDRKTLVRYEKELGIVRLERAINYGVLRWFTRPFTQLMSVFAGWVGNFGLAIIMLTTLIKLVLFPLFNRQYASQAKMKKLAPKQKRLQEVYKDDRVKLQQEVMKLYREAGVNPLSGCLPIIPTIFIFFALYKTVFINIDLRHAPFFGWIQDLSARDPLSILNGFGAMPWDGMPGGLLSFFAIGPLAILYGISMAMTFSLSSAQTPSSGNEMMEMQMKIFKWMPWIFMFILAPFAAGLLIYWIWNNILSFAQQYYITRKYNVETSFDRFFSRKKGQDKDVAETD